MHVGEHHVRIFHGESLVATHRRAVEPHAIVREPSRYDGLWRKTASTTVTAASTSSLVALGRSLDDYAAAIEVAS